MSGKVQTVLSHSYENKQRLLDRSVGETLRKHPGVGVGCKALLLLSGLPASL